MQVFQLKLVYRDASRSIDTSYEWWIVVVGKFLNFCSALDQDFGNVITSCDLLGMIAS